MNAFFTGVVGAVSEAWQELRIHRTRVLLSLVGVAVAVCAITVVVGIGGIAQQATQESSDRGGGRAASIQVAVYPQDPAAQAPNLDDEWPKILERYDVTYGSRLTYGTSTVQFVDGAVLVATMGVDAPYATMHRLQLERGDWFTQTDAERLAPVVVVNPAFWQRIGSPDLATHPTVTVLGEQKTTVVVTGVYRSNQWDTEPQMYMLQDAYTRVVPDDPDAPTTPLYEMWVPPEQSEAIVASLQADLDATFGDGAEVSVSRSDWGAYQEGDPYLPIKLMVAGVAVLVLLLGALGLVNIALVTVRYRIREIGIRRSFGATSGRIFFSVMLESVVATVVAGFAGVAGAILIVTSPLVRDTIGQGMVSDFPPFPVEAAVLGLVAATVVGAIAGLLPALVAVRVKVIDAIRY
jgi:putative ABC transport system permease protein